MDLDSIFTSLPAKFVFAFVFVIALVLAMAWLYRRFGEGRLTAPGTRGRQPRLAVIDAAQVDGRRRLILIRRDNVEHLLMIGGPTDVVVEMNVVRGNASGREVAPARAGAADMLPRPVPLDDATLWPLQPEPGPRPRPNIPEDIGQWPLQPEPQLRPEPPPRRAPEPHAAEMARPAPPPAARPASEPPRAAPVAAPDTATADHNLAEMAYRLEAALRRPGTDTRQAAEMISRTEPAPERGAEPVRAPRAEPRPPRTEPKVEMPKPEPAKPAFTSLEQEMASLLGRPSGKGS